MVSDAASLCCTGFASLGTDATRFALFSKLQRQNPKISVSRSSHLKLAQPAKAKLGGREDSANLSCCIIQVGRQLLFCSAALGKAKVFPAEESVRRSSKNWQWLRLVLAKRARSSSSECLAVFSSCLTESVCVTDTWSLSFLRPCCCGAGGEFCCALVSPRGGAHLIVGTL